MKKKFTLILAITLIFSTIIISPITNSYNISILSNHHKPDDIFPSQNISTVNKGKIKMLFNKARYKIYNGEDPSNEIEEILAFSEIKNLIETISDKATANTIYTVFSDKPLLIKDISLIRYVHILEKNRDNNYLLQNFESEYKNLLKKKYYDY
ncbi:MAG TPA: hypothetical protein ENI44_01780 [Thermoplasmatales archaeon]|nr:hypothetical protein [Thermoplasmatales archaeon]